MSNPTPKQAAYHLLHNESFFEKSREQQVDMIAALLETHAHDKWHEWKQNGWLRHSRKCDGRGDDWCPCGFDEADEDMETPDATH